MFTNSLGSRGFLSGRRGRLYIAAVALGALALAGWLFFFVANDEYTWGRFGVVVSEARLSAPDRLDLIVRSCNRNPEVSLLRETDVDVQVKVVAPLHLSLLGGMDCLDIVEIQLREPLGDRVIVDRHTGQSVIVIEGVAQTEGAGGYTAEMPDVPAPKIGDAPNEAELENLRYIARQKGISLQTAIERYGWRDNFSLTAAQIREAVPAAFAGAEIVDDGNAWIAFKDDAPQAALDILNTFRSAHGGVSVQVRTNAGISEAELRIAIETVHYAVYGAPEVRNATTTFDHATSRITTTVVLKSGVSNSAIEDIEAVAKAKLIEATGMDILDSVSVVVVRSKWDVLGVFEGNR